VLQDDRAVPRAESTLQRTGTALLARGYMPWRVTRRLREFIRATRLTYPRGGNFFARWENGDVTRVEWTRTEPGDIEQVV
jgi:hypothetical protein